MSGRRESILREMGLGPIWRLRGSDARMEELEEADAPQPQAPLAPPIPQPRQKAPALLPAAMPDLAATQPGSHERPHDDGARAARIAQLEWDALLPDIEQCRACGLCEARQRVVPGMGDRAARVMFVGEGPGAEEDRQGLPFVGAAGKLLDAMLTAIGLSRDSGVYIANTVKCRPPHNRTPEANEMAACSPYLKRQIELVRPRLLVALGRPAAQVLLGDADVRINAARGKLFRHGDTPVLVSYHPAYLLRNPADKAKVWEDLCAVRRLLDAGPEVH